MEQLFHQVGDIIIRAVPAFIVFVLLHLYLKKVLFKPLERVLEERRGKTQGAIEAAEAVVRTAADKLDRYQQALSDARAGIYREQEVARRQLTAQQADAIEQARAAVNRKIAGARAGIQAEVDQARSSLALEADRLADTIAASILAGRN
jgi:F-type H+-transporting ATPase subunit b